MKNDSRLLLLDTGDNVLVAVATIPAGAALEVDGRLVTTPYEIPLGFKVAAHRIMAGEKILKYRAAIGSATCDIEAGEPVHLHNMKSDYLPTYTRDQGQQYGQH
jgi:hypothetical protein